MTATGLVGYLYAAYDTLTAWLGPPDPDATDEDKTNAEWTLTTGGGTVHVYDLDSIGAAGTTPGERHLNAACQTLWHVGAASEQIARDVFGAAFTPADQWISSMDGDAWDRALARTERAGRPPGLDGVRRAAGGGAPA